MASGDIRVLLALDVIFSAIYATGVVWGLSYLNVAAYTIENVAILTAVLTVVTYLAVLR
ncbi:MAG: hypothetical protein ABEJ71_03555 [Halodesulfurarchaeum sp.]